MVTVKKYYAQPDQVDGNDEDIRVKALAPVVGESCDDDEAVLAMKYLLSVSRESRSLPFATVADFPDRDQPEPRQSVDDSAILPRISQKLTDSIHEYFLSLRMLLVKPDLEPTDIVVDFQDATWDLLSSASEPSIISGIEDLSELTSDLDPQSVAKWLFALLVHLQLPLLDTTSASLQSLRRFCDSPPASTLATTRSQLRVCAVIIGSYFGQI